MQQDYAEAMKWYRQAAELGHAAAQYYLGSMYSIGEGFRTMPDYAEALRWYRKAADQDFVAAQKAIGDHYLLILHDKAEARDWYLKAAENGAVDAPQSLGTLYSSRGFKDLVRAYMWFQIGEATDKSRSFHLRNRKNSIAKDMTPEQIAEAQRMARDWMTEHPR